MNEEGNKKKRRTNQKKVIVKDATKDFDDYLFEQYILNPRENSGIKDHLLKRNGSKTYRSKGSKVLTPQSSSESFISSITNSSYALAAMLYTSSSSTSNNNSSSSSLGSSSVRDKSSASATGSSSTSLGSSTTSMSSSGGQTRKQKQYPVTEQRKQALELLKNKNARTIDTPTNGGKDLMPNLRKSNSNSGGMLR